MTSAEYSTSHQRALKSVVKSCDIPPARHSTWPRFLFLCQLFDLAPVPLGQSKIGNGQMVAVSVD
jgi:hypothetical protein